MTHDTLPEISWKPIKKRRDRIPPQRVLEEKVLLREWEMDQYDKYFKNVYNRRDLDIDVFKKF